VLFVHSATMEYRGIRYTLRLGIERQKWAIGIHPHNAEPVEKAFKGTRLKAEHHAQSMIDTYKRRKLAVADA
jgi:hypothetical protein